MGVERGLSILYCICRLRLILLPRNHLIQQFPMSISSVFQLFLRKISNSPFYFIHLALLCQIQISGFRIYFIEKKYLLFCIYTLKNMILSILSYQYSQDVQLTQQYCISVLHIHMYVIHCVQLKQLNCIGHIYGSITKQFEK